MTGLSNKTKWNRVMNVNDIPDFKLNRYLKRAELKTFSQTKFSFNFLFLG